MVPAPYRKALGLVPGKDVVVLLQEDGLHVLTAKQAITRAQALVRRYVGVRRRLSNELLKERKREVRGSG